MRWIFVFIFLNSTVVSSLFASTYTGILPRDLSILTPLEGNAVSEFNDCNREIKRVYLNQLKVTAITGTYTATGTETVLIGSSTSAFTITLPAASAVGSSTCTKWMIVKNANTGTITVSATIDGVGTHTLSQNQVMSAFADASLWYRADMRNFSILTADEGTVTTFHADSIDADNGTFTAIRSATANFTATTTVNGVSGLVDADVPNTITLDNATQITTRRLSDMQGLVDLGTQSTGAVTDAQVPNTITIDDVTQITTRRLSDMQGKIGLGTQTDSPYLIKWRVGSTEGTGTLAFVAGAGISLSPIYSNGEGTITATAVGTASAGGWLDTGTQTQSTAGYPIDARGTVTLRPNFGIAGMTDADVPDTVTLTNITQITNRDFASLQGVVGLGTQTAGTISFGTQTSGKVQLGTQTNYGDFVKWKSLSTQGTSTLGIATSGGATHTVSYDGVNGTVTISTMTKAYGMAYKTANQTFTAGTWTNIALDGGNNNLFNATHSTSVSPERFTVLGTGTYRVGYKAHFADTGNIAQACARLLKNGATEVPGSYEYVELLGGGSNENGDIVFSQVLVSLNANDFLTLQCGIRNTSTIMKYITAGLPAPSGSYTAAIIVEKIDD